MNLPQEYVSNKAREGVIVYRDSALKKLWSTLQTAQSNVEYTDTTLNKICDLLLRHVKVRLGDAVFLHAAIPVYLLRGGLFFLSAFQRIKPYTSFGLIVPYRSQANSPPAVIYGDLPLNATDGVYLFLDLIMNTGATVIASLRAVCNVLDQEAGKCRSMHVVSPFITAKAIDTILDEFASVLIHTFWDNMVIGPDGRLVGLRFDAGDYACGGGARIFFTGRKGLK